MQDKNRRRPSLHPISTSLHSSGPRSLFNNWVGAGTNTLQNEHGTKRGQNIVDMGTRIGA